MANLDSKKQVVEEIKGKLQDAAAAVIVDYKGLNVKEATELRKRFRDAGVEYKVYKNTLVKIAVKDTAYEKLSDELVGVNGIAIGTNDPLAPAKILFDFNKEFKKLELKSGVVEGVYYNPDMIKELAQVPSKEVLIAKLLGSFKAPISNFAYLVKAIADKKEQQA